MVRQMTATEVKAKILALLEEVAAGDEVEITKHGHTVARLVPARGPHTLRGRFTGVAVSPASDEELFSTGAAWDLPCPWCLTPTWCSGGQPSPRISAGPRSEIEGADGIAVSSISWFELAWLAHHGRISLAVPVRSWLEGLAEEIRTITTTAAIADTAAGLPPSFPGDPPTV